jgi:hypothetical protein
MSDSRSGQQSSQQLPVTRVTCGKQTTRQSGYPNILNTAPSTPGPSYTSFPNPPSGRCSEAAQQSPIPASDRTTRTANHRPKDTTPITYYFSKKDYDGLLDLANLRIADPDQKSKHFKGGELDTAGQDCIAHASFSNGESFHDRKAHSVSRISALSKGHD